jgi:hypothetical protein
MSSESLPINPARFAEAIKDLPLSSLHLKVLEIRNSIAHLDYSNEQLRPFAEGREPVLGSSSLSAPGGQTQPDQDCIDAIKENEAVIERMQGRIGLIRSEVESRGASWTEFQSKEEAEAQHGAQPPTTNGDAGESTSASQPDGETQQTHSAWSDGTFQTGTIRNGEVHMDGPGNSGGGRLSDDQLRRMLEERLGEDQEEDGTEGMHL